MRNRELEIPQNFLRVYVFKEIKSMFELIIINDDIEVLEHPVVAYQQEPMVVETIYIIYPTLS